MKSISPLLILFLLLACGQQQKTENQSRDSIAAVEPAKVTTPIVSENMPDSIPAKPVVNPYEKAHVEVKTFQNTTSDEAKGTWGYDIKVDGNPYIHQPNIPPMPGIKGFTTEQKAHKAGEFVAYKIKHNIMPPSVTPHELDSLGLLK
jgi:hypothetical protein